MQSLEQDLELLVRDKYGGDATRVTEEERARLAAGEPLAYIIGWIPFCGTRILLDSRPLIPRPETEWWTEKRIEELRDKNEPMHVLDLCAGSGCIGVAILAALPRACVTFVELDSRHADTIRASLTANGIDQSRAHILTGDLWDALLQLPKDLQHPFSTIATNPPYIPATRTLDASVVGFEPHKALFAGDDGLALISRIATGAREHLIPGGEIWVECDITNIHATRDLFVAEGAAAQVVDDQYNRPRLVVASWQ